MKPGLYSERAVILAPKGRDAAVAEALIREAGYYAQACPDFAALLHEIEGGAGCAVIADEAIKTVVIDSLNGYQAAMPEENSLILHMHELLQYLNRRGAATFMTVAQHGLVGDMKAPIDVTYLADTVILLRYFESSGSVRRAISVIKKRTGNHEDTIREYRIDNRGLTIGAPLTEFQGVLRGVPVYNGSTPLLEELAT